MKRKRLITIGLVVLALVSSTAAYGAWAESGIIDKPAKTETQPITIPAEKIGHPVKKYIIISGPVRSVEITSGPALRSDAPIVGSYDWMAQEKAAKDKLKSDAEKRQAILESQAAKVQADLEAEIFRLEKIASNTQILNQTLILVKERVDKTPWVFQGSTPQAWDCSGLVRWTYAHLDVDLWHSASTQRLSGEFVTEPKIGDLVSFNHKSHGSAYHIGIYIGPDEMIHAGGKPGDKTEIRSISGWAKDNGGSTIKYTRIVETNN
jgi:cell wall-associated NlpC family hydrolase